MENRTGNNTKNKIRALSSNGRNISAIDGQRQHQSNRNKNDDSDKGTNLTVGAAPVSSRPTKRRIRKHDHCSNSTALEEENEPPLSLIKLLQKDSSVVRYFQNLQQQLQSDVAVWKQRYNTVANENKHIHQENEQLHFQLRCNAHKDRNDGDDDDASTSVKEEEHKQGVGIQPSSTNGTNETIRKRKRIVPPQMNVHNFDDDDNCRKTTTSDHKEENDDSKNNSSSSRDGSRIPNLTTTAQLRNHTDQCSTVEHENNDTTTITPAVPLASQHPTTTTTSTKSNRSLPSPPQSLIHFIQNSTDPNVLMYFQQVQTSLVSDINIWKQRVNVYKKEIVQLKATIRKLQRQVRNFQRTHSDQVAKKKKTPPTKQTSKNNKKLAAVVAADVPFTLNTTSVNHNNKDDDQPNKNGKEWNRNGTRTRDNMIIDNVEEISIPDEAFQFEDDDDDDDSDSKDSNNEKGINQQRQQQVVERIDTIHEDSNCAVDDEVNETMLLERHLEHVFLQLRETYDTLERLGIKLVTIIDDNEDEEENDSGSDDKKNNADFESSFNDNEGNETTTAIDPITIDDGVNTTNTIPALTTTTTTITETTTFCAASTPAASVLNPDEGAEDLDAVVDPDMNKKTKKKKKVLVVRRSDEEIVTDLIRCIRSLVSSLSHDDLLMTFCKTKNQDDYDDDQFFDCSSHDGNKCWNDTTKTTNRESNTPTISSIDSSQSLVQMKRDILKAFIIMESYCTSDDNNSSKETWDSYFSKQREQIMVSETTNTTTNKDHSDTVDSEQQQQEQNVDDEATDNVETSLSSSLLKLRCMKEGLRSREALVTDFFASLEEEISVTWACTAKQYGADDGCFVTSTTNKKKKTNKTKKNKAIGEDTMSPMKDNSNTTLELVMERCILCQILIGYYMSKNNSSIPSSSVHGTNFDPAVRTVLRYILSTIPIFNNTIVQNNNTNSYVVDFQQQQQQQPRDQHDAILLSSAPITFSFLILEALVMNPDPAMIWWVAPPQTKSAQPKMNDVQRHDDGDDDANNMLPTTNNTNDTIRSSSSWFVDWYHQQHTANGSTLYRTVLQSTMGILSQIVATMLQSQRSNKSICDEVAIAELSSFNRLVRANVLRVDHHDPVAVLKDNDDEEEEEFHFGNNNTTRTTGDTNSTIVTLFGKAMELLNPLLTYDGIIQFFQDDDDDDRYCSQKKNDTRHQIKLLVLQILVVLLQSQNSLNRIVDCILRHDLFWMKLNMDISIEHHDVHDQEDEDEDAFKVPVGSAMKKKKSAMVAIHKYFICLAQSLRQIGLQQQVDCKKRLNKKNDHQQQIPDVWKVCRLFVNYCNENNICRLFVNYCNDNNDQPLTATTTTTTAIGTNDRVTLLPPLQLICTLIQFATTLSDGESLCYFFTKYIMPMMLNRNQLPVLPGKVVQETTNTVGTDRLVFLCHSLKDVLVTPAIRVITLQRRSDRFTSFVSQCLRESVVVVKAVVPFIDVNDKEDDEETASKCNIPTTTTTVVHENNASPATMTTTNTSIGIGSSGTIRMKFGGYAIDGGGTSHNHHHRSLKEAYDSIVQNEMIRDTMLSSSATCTTSSSSSSSMLLKQLVSTHWCPHNLKAFDVCAPNREYYVRTSPSEMACALSHICSWKGIVRSLKELQQPADKMNHGSSFNNYYTNPERCVAHIQQMLSISGYAQGPALLECNKNMGPVPVCIVMEDDAILCPNFRQRFTELCQVLPRDFHFCSLGYSRPSKAPIIPFYNHQQKHHSTSNNNNNKQSEEVILGIPTMLWYLTGYCISLAGAEYMLSSSSTTTSSSSSSSFLPIVGPVDSYIGLKMMNNWDNIYGEQIGLGRITSKHQHQHQHNQQIPIKNHCPPFSRKELSTILQFRAFCSYEPLCWQAVAKGNNNNNNNNNNIPASAIMNDDIDDSGGKGPDWRQQRDTDIEYSGYNVPILTKKDIATDR